MGVVYKHIKKSYNVEDLRQIGLYVVISRLDDGNLEKDLGSFLNTQPMKKCSKTEMRLSIAKNPQD